MKTILLPLLLGLATASADENLRSAAYRAGSGQAEIHAASGSLLAELDAILAEVERNNLTGESLTLASKARADLSSAREDVIAQALSELRALSESGDAAELANVFGRQQKAEIILRQISVKLAKRQPQSEIPLLVKAILDRQVLAIHSESTGTTPDALTGEQQAISLQIQDLVSSLDEPATDLPPQTAGILSEASKAAAQLNLTGKASAALAGPPESRRTLRDAVDSIYKILVRLTPSKERLLEVAAAIARLQKDQAAHATDGSTNPQQAEGLAAQATTAASKIASESPAAAAELEKAAQALQKGNKGEAADEAKKALLEAAKAVDQQIAKTETAEAAPLGEVAQQLQRMAAEAQQLAQNQSSIPENSRSTPAQASIESQTAELQSAAAPTSPDAAASLEKAREKMKEGDSKAAAAALAESAKKLASQANAAAAAASEDAKLSALQSALGKAEAENNAAAKKMESGSPGEAAAEALKNQNSLQQLASAAALSAAMANQQPATKASVPAMSQAAQATSQAAASTLKAAQEASRQSMSSAMSANNQAAQNLAAAASALADRRSALRSQSGLPAASENTPEMNGGDSQQGSGHVADYSSSSVSQEPTTVGPAGVDQKDFKPEERAAMAELRKTPVPQEYSGQVQAYFESIAKN